jgi:guanylate kinase
MHKIFVISSLSASGKTTLVNELLNHNQSIYKLKTCTTRPIRDEEIGDEYYFMSKYDMEIDILCNRFIEYSIVYGNYYGLKKDEVENNKYKDSLVILDIQGVKKFTKLYPDAITIFIEPPPMGELIKRLKERNTPVNDINNRISCFKKELNQKKKFKELVKYDTLENMKTQLFNIIDYYRSN